MSQADYAALKKKEASERQPHPDAACGTVDGKLSCAPVPKSALSTMNWVVSDKFGENPEYVGGTGGFHYGVDFQITEQPTLAVMDGKVISITSGAQRGYYRSQDLIDQYPYLFSKPGEEPTKVNDFSLPVGNNGNTVAVQHEDGSITVYAHLSRVDVVVGASVVAGQQIGVSGNTGYTVGATGMHLHWEYWRPDEGVMYRTDPLDAIRWWNRQAGERVMGVISCQGDQRSASSCW